MFKTTCISIMPRVKYYPAILNSSQLSELKIKSTPFFWPRLSIFCITFHNNYQTILTSCRWNCKLRRGCFKARRANCKGARWETLSFLVGQSFPQPRNHGIMCRCINMIGLFFVKTRTILFVRAISKMSIFEWPVLFVLVDDILMAIDRTSWI